MSTCGTRHSVLVDEAWGWPDGWPGPPWMSSSVAAREWLAGPCGGGWDRVFLQGQIHLCSWPGEGEASRHPLPS